MMFHKPSWNQIWIVALLAVLPVFGGERLLAAQLKSETLKSWATYVRSTESRIEQERKSGTKFLVLDFQPPQVAAADRKAILEGDVPVAKMESLRQDGTSIPVPDGMIHHWRGSVFIPGVDLDFVLTRVENPVTQEIKQEDVLRSEVLERGEGYLKLFLKLQRSKIVTVVYNTEHDIRYQRQQGGRAWSSSKAIKIAEVENPMSPAEREKPIGQDHGFLWRLNSYWRYEQVSGGVIVECESISLSRSIPALLEFIARPIINSVAKESMQRTLTSLRDRIVSSRQEGKSVVYSRKIRTADSIMMSALSMKQGIPYEGPAVGS